MKGQAGGFPAVQFETLPATLDRTLHALANEALVEAPFALAGFANAAEMGEDGWTLIPYGEWPHAEGVQRFTQASAEKIVSSFKSAWGEFKRAFIGLPVYRGHPDLKGLENTYPDKTEYGQIADMEARPQGLAIKQVLSSSGAGLVRAGLRFISPHWLANAVGTTATGNTIYEPVRMKSVGLTNKPNIPNKSLVNTAEAGTKTMNKEKLIKLLGLVPLANATEVTDEQIEQAVAAAHARPTAEALANEKASVVSLTQRAQSAEDSLKKAKADLDTASVAIANEKRSKIDGLLDASVKVGKIAAVDKDLWRKRLELNFEGESVALVNSAQTVKTTATVEQTRLAALDAKMKERTTLANDADGDKDGDIASMVNAEMATPAVAAIKNPTARYNTAFGNVAKKHPKMFEPVIPAGA